MASSIRAFCESVYAKAESISKENRTGKILVTDIFKAIELIQTEQKSTKKYTGEVAGFLSQTFTNKTALEINNLVILYKLASENLAPTERGEDKPLAKFGVILEKITSNSDTATRASARIGHMHFANKSTSAFADFRVWIHELCVTFTRIFSKLSIEKRQELTDKLAKFEKSALESLPTIVQGKSEQEIQKNITALFSKFLNDEIKISTLPSSVQANMNEEINKFREEIKHIVTHQPKATKEPEEKTTGGTPEPQKAASPAPKAPSPAPKAPTPPAEAPTPEEAPSPLPPTVSAEYSQEEDVKTPRRGPPTPPPRETPASSFPVTPKTPAPTPPPRGEAPAAPKTPEASSGVVKELFKTPAPKAAAPKAPPATTPGGKKASYREFWNTPTSAARVKYLKSLNIDKAEAQRFLAELNKNSRTESHRIDHKDTMKQAKQFLDDVIKSP